MLSFAHYRFKQFLKHKAFEFGKVVVDVCEAYIDAMEEVYLRARRNKLI